MGGYLSERALAGLKSYEYKPAGYTILDTLHTPFWNCESRSMDRSNEAPPTATAGALAPKKTQTLTRPQNARSTNPKKQN